MNKLSLLFIALPFLFSCSTEQRNQAPLKTEKGRTGTGTSSIINLTNEFDSINKLIRDNKIDRDAALLKIQQLLPEIKATYFKPGDKNEARESRVFPLRGYSFKAIGGKNGSGYIPQGYDYFDGDRHKGHPAHDIFIHDKNQDCMDDRTGKYVEVLSLSGGIVVATERNWDFGSTLRGGKCIWIYDPASNSLFYYAHNSQILANTGQILEPGDIIARVGRTGLNAYKKRSPTHLHIMQLQFDRRHYPLPIDLYQTLRTIGTNKETEEQSL